MTSLAVVQSAVAYPFAAFGRVEVGWSNVIGLPDATDNALDIPEDELIFVGQSPKTRVMSVRLVISRVSEAALNDSLAQLAGLIWTPDDPILMRRVIPFTAGSQTSEAYFTYLSGFDPGEKPAPNIAALALQFRMLSAYWYDTTTSLAVAL